MPAPELDPVTSKPGQSPYRTDGFAELRDYAPIGDGRTVALVALDGAIDWLPLLDIDSRPVFAALLDRANGGKLELRPTAPFRTRRRYVPNTNVLETASVTDSGEVRVTDSLNVGVAGRLPWSELGRRVDGVGGTVEMQWRVAPGTCLDTASPRGAANTARHGVSGEWAEPRGVCIRQCSNRFHRPGRIGFVRGVGGQASRDRGERLEGRAADALARRRGRPRHRPDHRGLVEVVETVRAHRSLARRGAPQRADAQAADLQPHRRDRGGRDDVAAGGPRRRQELGLPLRVGARRRVHVGGVAPLRNSRGAAISWLLRTVRRHYTTSKLGCWQALRWAVHLAEMGQIPGDPKRWAAEADRISDWVQRHCWSEELGGYEWYPGSATLDASILLHAGSGFDRGPRMSSTIDALTRHLGSGPLMYRFSGAREDGEGASVACGFWRRRPTTSACWPR